MHLDMNTKGKVRFEKNAIIITHYEIRNARSFPPTPSTHCGMQPWLLIKTVGLPGDGSSEVLLYIRFNTVQELHEYSTPIRRYSHRTLHVYFTKTTGRQFSGQWFGRGGPKEFLPQCPDLTPRDLFSCNLVKEKVCLQNKHLINLRQQIPDTSPAAFLDFLARRILLLSWK